MKTLSQKFLTIKTAKPAILIKTTLYELIETINEEVHPGEDSLVTEVVVHLLDSEKIKYIGTCSLNEYDQDR
ncbi:MAG: hypothetical protein JRG73_19215 [Deltaproteobacteria bacterium]|nr:hypothetical protein [Deltaproteobacteria bacterium]MBW2149588.1 hypothetical protein [Deltaproteobacteria bacterium]MBW2309059.1 hypothetical protein [Deltaproteobacteria bacterium]